MTPQTLMLWSVVVFVASFITFGVSIMVAFIDLEDGHFCKWKMIISVISILIMTLSGLSLLGGFIWFLC